MYKYLYAAMLLATSASLPAATYLSQQGYPQSNGSPQVADPANINIQDLQGFVQRILTQLPLRNRGNIRITLHDGTVTFEGTVQNEKELELLDRLIDRLNNLEFESNVEVQSEYSSFWRRTTNQVAYNNGNAGRATISDNELQQRIKKELGDSWFGQGYKEVQIDVNNGIVTITGIVDSDSDIKEIENRLSGIQGIKTIQNHLSAKSSKDPSKRVVDDRSIKQKIEQELKDSWWDSYENVQVEVDNGVVVLKGSVSSKSDLTDIDERLREIPGVKVIRNQLLVEEN